MELEERVARVERKPERGGRGKWPGGYEVSNVGGIVLPELAINSTTTIKNIAAVNSSGTRGRHTYVRRTLNSTRARAFNSERAWHNLV